HGKRQFHFEYEDLAVVVRIAIESFQVNAEAQGFTLVTDIREPLPELKMDADAIFQVILNLLNNALKFSDKEKKIWIRAYRQKASVIIEVEDHGIGIPAGEKAKIFKDFYRVDQRLNTEAQGGLGLGLTLAQDIVQAHHGNITVDSEVGKGSIFRVILPVQETGTLDDPGEIPLKRPTINSQQAEQQVS
ncbi:MAG: GHKL domain-containing protein, partial [Calditrichaeota bacterium]